MAFKPGRQGFQKMDPICTKKNVRHLPTFGWQVLIIQGGIITPTAVQKILSKG
jgi:hypothetical protein